MYSDLFFYTSSDDEDEVNSELAMFTEACQAAYEASKPKVQRTPVERDRYGAHDRLVMAYFSEHPQYGETTFHDCTGQRGISSLMKCTSAICQMAYESVPDSLDEYLQMGATIAQRASDVPFVANNVLYKRGYYLTGGIYQQWSVLIKSIKNPGTHGHKRKLHEAARKDVERAFGVLKQKWKLIKYPARGMSRSRLSDVMYTCIILHNMIIHDNGNAISPDFFPEEQHRDDDPVRTHEESMQVTQEIVNRTAHLSLKADLVEHIWNNAN
ncbi:ALP1-like protein [Tanacetum coccineum]